MTVGVLDTTTRVLLEPLYTCDPRAFGDVDGLRLRGIPRPDRVE